MTSHSELWKKILSGAAIVSGVTIIARLCQAGRDILISARMGTSYQVDAYLLAMAFPLFVATIWQSAVMGAVVPALIRIRHKTSEEAASSLLKGAIVYTVVVLGSITLGYMAFLAGWIWIHPEGSPTVKLFRVLALYAAPTIILSGVTAVLAGNLNSRSHFALAGLTSALPPFVSGLILWMLFPALGVRALILGIGIGTVAELIWVLPKNRTDFRAAQTWKPQGQRQELRTLIADSLPIIISSLILAFNPVVDQLVAASLGSGNVAAISLGGKIVAFPLAVAATGLGVAIVPSLATAAAGEDWKTFPHLLKTGTVACILLGSLCAVLLILFTRPITALVYQRGTFTSADTVRVSAVQACYALQIPFYLVGMLMARGLAILQGMKSLYWMTTCGALLNLGLDLLFGHIWGAPGIALATSCVYTFTAVVLMVVVARHTLRRKLSAEQLAREQVPTGFVDFEQNLV